MSRPVSLIVGVVLIWVGALVGLIAGFDLMASALAMARSDVARHLEETLVAQGVTDVAGDLLLIGLFLAGALITVMSLARIVVSSFVLQGRRWARILITVLIGLNLIVGVAYLFEGYVMRMLLTVPLDIVVLWLFFNDSSSEYFRKRTKEEALEVADAA